MIALDVSQHFFKTRPSMFPGLFSTIDAVRFQQVVHHHDGDRGFKKVKLPFMDPSLAGGRRYHGQNCLPSSDSRSESSQRQGPLLPLQLTVSTWSTVLGRGLNIL